MAVREALLTLLSVEPSYAFRLHTELIRRLPNRSRLNVGQSYSTLERARGAKLLNAAGSTDDGLPQFALTEEGNRAVDGWLRATDAPPVSAEETSDRVLLRLSLGAMMHDRFPSPAQVLESSLRLWSARAASREFDPVTVGDAAYVDLQQREAHTMIEWLTSIAERDAREFELPFLENRPRRGRPKRTEGD